ncbi:MAG: YihY/virulence factor BrkB family protein [Lentisphaeria bacterium]
MAEPKTGWEERLWALELAPLSKPRRAGVRMARLASGAVRVFLRHNGPLQASALTYITLMSMVPVLALMFSVSKGLGAHEKLMEMVRGKLHDLPPQVGTFANQVFEYVDQTNFSTLGTVGLLLMLWSVVGVMGKIEGCFNDIWQVRTPRTLVRKMEDYISILVVVPILFLATMSVNAALSAPGVIHSLHTHLGALARPVEVLISLAGTACITGAFAIFYVFMPNTRVKWSAALLAGVITGVVWQATQWAYIKFQVGVAGYNAIYGTFAVIPFFLAWLYANWMIVLFGAALCYALQNREVLDPALNLASLAQGWREELAVWTMADACAAYRQGGAVWRAADFARQNGLPAPLELACARFLAGRGLLLEVAGEEGAFVPGRTADSLTVADVESVLREAGGVPERWRKLTPPEHPAIAALRNKRSSFTADMKQVTLEQLAKAAANRPTGPP